MAPRKPRSHRPGNPLCRCEKEGAWSDEARARAALHRVQRTKDPNDPYVPVDVYTCDEGIWHLTSGPVGKPHWGDRSRKPATRRSRWRSTRRK